MALARVTGVALNTSTIAGTAKQSGNPYRMTFCKVLVEEQDLTEVNLPDSIRPPTKGEPVDYLVEFGTYAGRLSARVLAEYAA